MASWREEILAGVQTVEYEGCVPGYIIVYGDNSEAILSNKTGEVLIAAGELGKGRVVVFSHNTFTRSYLKSQLPPENAVLLGNVRDWVSRGKATVAVDIDHQQAFDDIPDDAFLVWSAEDKDGVFLQKMLRWVEEGGGLICGTCPWGHAQVTGTPIEDIPLKFIMSKLGMCFATCDDYFSTSDRLSVSENCSEHGRIDQAIELLKTDGDLCKVKKTLTNITSLPFEVCQKVSPHVKDLASKCNCAPTRDNPARGVKEKLAVSMMCHLMIKDGLPGVGVVADGCKQFPGDFDKPPELTTVELEISGKGNRYVPTGCYLPAGAQLVLSWDEMAGNWSVVVGAHTDELFHVTGELRRWPKVSICRKMNSSPLRLCSPFGGLVYFESPSAQGKMKVTLTNIVPAPRFTYETENNWDTESKKPGLWCDISGERLTITLPSESIRGRKAVGATMRLWDQVVRAHAELRGHDPNEGRGQWIVTDEQPSAGYMHSGYPIVTHMDVADPSYKNGNHFLLNGDGIVNPKDHGFWGVFHELGHNFQFSSWTWEGTGEVTVNIFTLHAMDTICKLKPWIHPWLAGHMPDIENYLREGADYEQWKSIPSVALAIYAQQARDFGWEPFKKVFREYEGLPSNQQPKTNEDKIQQWMVRFSKATGRNLCPAFEFWGFPYTEHARELVSGLPPYLPKDETTKDMAPERAKEIARKYNIEL